MIEQFLGAMLGHALGDAIGAPFEGGVIEKVVWKGLGLTEDAGTLRWTDDTQMALITAESLLERGGFDPDHLAHAWANGAQWRRGYGKGARRLLQRIRAGEAWRDANRSVFPDGSFGNGAAMRATPIGLYAHAVPSRLVEIATVASSITHAHPLGIGGGVLLARATAEALRGVPDPQRFLGRLEADQTEPPYQTRIEVARKMLAGPKPSVSTVQEKLGNSVLAHESAVTAVYVALSFRDGPFEELMRFVISLGGDVDTIGAMAGGIWGAMRGVDALPADALARLEARDRIEGAARRLHALAAGSGSA